MNLTAILAQADDGTIGLNGKLPWDLPEDLKRFKALTLGHAVIMGRKTYDSIGRPLPRRRNIVISRSENAPFVPGVEVYKTPELALTAARETDDAPYVIGGGQIYQALWAHVTRVELTHVHAEFHGLPTTTFDFERQPWIETRRERAKEHHDVEFVTLERRPA